MQCVHVFLFERARAGQIRIGCSCPEPGFALLVGLAWLLQWLRLLVAMFHLVTEAPVLGPTDAHARPQATSQRAMWETRVERASVRGVQGSP